MRAAVVWEPGGGFSVHDDVEHREPSATDVVVRVEVAGLCATDLSLASGAWGQPMPVVLGHEGAGTVIAVGSAVRSLRVGDHVVLTWIPPCMRCYFCQIRQEHLCSGRKSTRHRGEEDMIDVGGRAVHVGMGTATFAEECVVPENGVVAVPKDLPFTIAAVLGCAVPTGVGAALNSAKVQPGESVLVVGCGAVGLSAVQGACIAGAAVIAVCDPRADRRELARTLGATHDAPDPGGLPDLTDGRGFDVSIDAVGTATTIRAAWDAARRGGRVSVVGAGRLDDVVGFSAYELFHEEKLLVGSLYGSMSLHRALPRLVDLWRHGRLDLDWLTGHRYALADIRSAADHQGAGQILRALLVPN